MAFLEDPLMEGMLLARDSKKISARLRAEASEEAKKEAQQAMAKGEQEEMVRSLLGPRGGLPHLRGDLVRLAHLLHLEVGAKDTIDMLKEKIRPMLAIMSMKAPTQQSPTKSPTKSEPAKTAVGQPSVAPGSDLSMSDLKATVTQEQLANLMIDQESRFKVMIQETLQAMMSYPLQPPQPAESTTREISPGSWGLPSDDQMGET